jgi:hypothetical protein
VVYLPQEYQRLVANPFLALALLIAWLGAMRLALGARRPAAAALAAAGVFAVVRTLHFHCLDCGRTGWLFRWRDHACEAVVARQLADRVRRWRGPRPTVQLVLWLYLFALVAIVASILRVMPEL